MQVKVVIGTVAFMLTMVVLGYAALREPARLEDFAGAAHGRSIETGAQIYADNCASCHGIDGTAESGTENGCVDASGDPNCVGLPLNDYFLLCGEPSKRLLDVGWEGTIETFVKKTVTAGRGAIMPAWLNEFGGPMRPDQVNNVSNFVLNWGSPEFCEDEPVIFVWPEPGPGAAAEYQIMDITDPVVFQAQSGDPVAGEAVYLANGCSGCHGLPDQEGSAALGPWLGDIAETGGSKIDGYSAQDYIYESILDQNAFISPDCPTGPCTDPSLMSGSFANSFGRNPQDMADMLAFLMGDAYEYP
ncbi:MAG: c-type cytochrome [Chloroflexi bacterium]|nr:c-type cytochrome [Chloroflexota bacterium]